MTCETSAGTLAGLRVIDLSRVLGGPYCTQILADHGADVIKVEPPAGDETRAWGPPFLGGDAAYFLGVNRNKRSIALDLSTTGGREVLLRMLGSADVLIENFRIGTLERWGLGAEMLASRFPRLVHCRISGFGAEGPHGGDPGYDIIIQAMSGLIRATGSESSGPMRIGVPLVDMATGLYAAVGILMALSKRERCGSGQFLETTLYDSALAIMHPHAANFFVHGRAPELSGNDHPNLSPYTVFSTATGPIFVGVGNDGSFARLCREIGRADLTQDPRFARNQDRVANREALCAALAEVFADQDAGELCTRLVAAGVPAGPVRGIDEALADPHTVIRGGVIEQDWYRGVASPIRLSRDPATLRHLPPRRSEHGAELLAEFGYGADEIEALTRQGVVGAAAP
ncbi:MAG: CoA transferase [Alphaproteobacteria bacterium]|nr:CoA transferase [Alphaproteobacteria bacterium]